MRLQLLREEIVPSSASSSEAQSEPSSTIEEPPLLPRPIESDLFRDNQLIHSWMERYRRDDPLVLPGDPDLGLNASQTKAIAMALGDRLSLIQGVRLPFSPVRLSFAERRRFCGSLGMIVAVEIVVAED